MSTTKPSEAAEEVAEALYALRRLFRGRQSQALGAARRELTQMEGRALSYFGRNPGAIQSEFVVHSGRDKGQVGRLIAGLKDYGLLKARADEADRRIQRLYLTDAGRAVQAAVQRETLRMARLAVEGLDDQERRLLADLLHRVRSNLEAADQA